MIAAIPLSLLLCGTATSQSTISNDQTQVGDVFSSQTLDVVTATDDTTVVTTSTANTFTGSVVSGDLAVTSKQNVSGNVAAQTTLNVASSSGPSTSLMTAASGNAGDANISGGGTLSGSYSQTSTSANISAESQINGPDANTADAAIAVQAIANSQGFGATDSAVNASITQASSSSAIANGGAIYGDVTDQASFSSVAAGNNITGASAGVASQAVTASQSNTGAITQATMFVNLGNSEVTSTNATSTGNNANLANTSGALSLDANQDNESYVRAQAVETSFAFGGANVSAYGVGNSSMAANIGPSVSMNNTQVNGAGGTESIASFSGDNGYDAFVSSTATGNAATGFACSACGGVATVHNSQTNLGDASATASVSLTSGARSVRSTATAVGNTGSFYVSSPGP